LIVRKEIDRVHICEDPPGTLPNTIKPVEDFTMDLETAFAMTGNTFEPHGIVIPTVSSDCADP
jgi:hypothetical protein